MKLIGRIVCWAKGHKRGKPINDRKEDFAPGLPHLIRERTHQTYACPRCGRETHYKVKPKPDSNNGAPTDGSAHFQEAT